MPNPPNNTTFYLDNDTTVDTGAGVDIRNLSGTALGSLQTQAVTCSHTQDGGERTWDPASTVSASMNAHSLQRLGWAIPVASFTPADSRCRGHLPAGNLTITVSLSVAWAGASPVGTPVDGMVPRASLWRYDPATDAGVLIDTGNGAATTWGSLENGTVKTVDIALSYSATDFQDGETLLLQLGFAAGALGNPLSGTVTYTYTLRIGTTAQTRFVFNTTSLRQLCDVSGAAALAAAGALGRRTTSARRAASVSLTGTGARVVEGFRSFTTNVTLSAAFSRTVESVRSFVATLTPAATGARAVEAARAFDTTLSLVGTLGRRVVGLTQQATLSLAGAYARRVEARRSGAAALSLGTAFGRAAIVVRAFAVGLSLVAELYVKLKKDVLNRLEGGGEIIVQAARKFFVVED